MEWHKAKTTEKNSSIPKMASGTNISVYVAMVMVWWNERDEEKNVIKRVTLSTKNVRQAEGLYE